MPIYIEIDELTVNALISASRYGKGFVSHKDIEKYWVRVAGILHDKYNITAILLLSKGRTNSMLQTETDLFKERTVEGKKGIALREGKTIHDLISRYMGYSSLRFLKAFRDDWAMSVFEDAPECAES